MTIRVLRVIEYEYSTPERMTEDMAGWTVSHHSKSLVMRSSVVAITPGTSYLLAEPEESPAKQKQTMNYYT